MMLLGVIADDFTGASDIGNTLAKGLPGQGGLRTAQFLGVPSTPAPQDVEAGVIALKSRSIPAREAVSQSVAALKWLQAQGCRQFVFKYCSTFDSTPGGNIGPVGEALAGVLGVRGVIACPAFPAVGRTLYQGHLFVGDRLLNESGLQNHPLNPMTDPDIRRWLARQSAGPVGLISLSTVKAGNGALSFALEAAGREGQTLVVVDAVDDNDLKTIAQAAALAPLITGGSGIAQGLPANFIASGLAAGSSQVAIRVRGPEAILAGSCSGATRQQIEIHARSHPVQAIKVEKVMEGTVAPESLVAFIEGHRGQAPLVFSGGTPQEVAALQHRFGREQLAESLDSLFASTARMLVERGVKRLVVAGGETSGAVVSALDLGALTVGGEIDPGVPALYAQGDNPIALALKSGNFGSPDFFDKALAKLEGR